MRRLPLLLVLVAALAGCGGGDGGSTKEQSITLQVFADPEEAAAYRQLTQAFTRANPGTDVRLVPVASQGDHQTKLATAFAAGRPPDLFLINYRRFGAFAARGALEPLGPLVEQRGKLDLGGFFPQAIDAFRFDGALQCLPQNLSTPVVYYNRALFREAELEPPKAGWTWDDMMAMAQTLTRGDVKGLGFEPSLNRFAPFIWQAGGEVVDSVQRPKKIALLDQRDREALQFLTDLQQRHHVVPTLAEQESEDPETRFANGRLGMLIESRRATTGLRAVDDLDWDVAPLPVHPRARTPAVMLHSDAYCMAAGSKKHDLALRFVEFALSREGATILARTGRTVPSTRAVAESDAFLDPSQPPRSARVFVDQISAIRRFPTVADWHELEAKADVVVEEWFFGAEPPEALGLEIDIATSRLVRGR